MHLVTVLEDMPVQETADGIAELRGSDLPVGGVVVNLARRPELDDETATRRCPSDSLDGETIRADLAEVGVEATTTLVDGLLDEAREHAERRGSRTSSANGSTSSTSRPTSCPGCPTASTSAVSTSSPPSCAQGMA